VFHEIDMFDGVMFFVCCMTVLLQFITAEHVDTLLETTRVLGNLTRARDVRDFAVKHRSMFLLDFVSYLLSHFFQFVSL